MRDGVVRTMALGLACLLLAGWGVQAGAASVRIGGMGGATVLLERMAEAYGVLHPGTGFTFVKPALGSSGAIKALALGKLDVALSARFLKPEEEAGFAARQRELGRTPLLFAVHRSLPVMGLTAAQLADAYGGRVSTWPDGSRLRVVLRPLSDSDSIVLQGVSHSMAEAVKAAHGRPGAVVAATELDCAEMVGKVPGAMGTVTLGHVTSERLPLKGLAVDGVEPTLAALEQGRYPFVKHLVMIQRLDAPAEVQAFTDFLFSPEGRALLADHGYAASAL